jgi:L-iditol 2-dehydrogenase
MRGAFARVRLRGTERSCRIEFTSGIKIWIGSNSSIDNSPKGSYLKAAVYYGPGEIRVEDRPEPIPTDDNIIVEVRFCAICGSDLKLATIGNPRCIPPRIIGHEMVGHIIHAGSAVKNFLEGQRVTLATTIACGNCAYCRLGLGNVCPYATPISYNIDGAFAERMAVPPVALAFGNVIEVPDGVSDEEAALSEPLSCAINAQNLAGVKKNDTVLVIGGGPLGALHAELAKANGAKNILIVQRSEPRLSLLRRMKDIVVIDGRRDDPLSIIGNLTDQIGADVVIVCAPTRSAHEDSLKFVRKGGTISLFASLAKGSSEITIDSRVLHYGEIRLVGSSDSRPEHVSAAVKLMSEKKITLEPIITHRVQLENIQEGLELMKNKQTLKILVSPRGGVDGYGHQVIQ